MSQNVISIQMFRFLQHRYWPLLYSKVLEISFKFLRNRSKCSCDNRHHLHWSFPDSRNFDPYYLSSQLPFTEYCYPQEINFTTPCCLSTKVMSGWLWGVGELTVIGKSCKKYCPWPGVAIVPTTNRQPLNQTLSQFPVNIMGNLIMPPLIFSLGYIRTWAD